MQARFYANMRTVMGMAALDVPDAQAATFRELLARLIERAPEARFHLLDAEGELRPDAPVYVDGRNPRLAPAGIDAPLRPGSVVSFFSPISSGRMNVEALREPNFRADYPLGYGSDRGGPGDRVGLQAVTGAGNCDRKEPRP